MNNILSFEYTLSIVRVFIIVSQLNNILSFEYIIIVFLTTLRSHQRINIVYLTSLSNYLRKSNFLTSSQHVIEYFVGICNSNVMASSFFISDFASLPFLSAIVHFSNPFMANFRRVSHIPLSLLSSIFTTPSSGNRRISLHTWSSTNSDNWLYKISSLS